MSDILQSYTDMLSELYGGCYTKPTLEDDYDLFVRLANGDCSAHDEIINRHYRLVKSIARSFANKNFGLEFDDLLQAGMLGLAKAINKYNMSYGCKFSTYAAGLITQAIIREIPNMTRAINPIKNNYRETMALLSKINELELRDGNKLTLEEIASELDISIDKCQMLLSYKTVILSYNELVDGENEFLDTFVDENCNVEELVLQKIMNSESIEKIMAYLDNNPKDKYIIFSRFGLGGYEQKTLSKLAAEYGVTHQRIMQIEERAIKRLRRLLNEDDAVVRKKRKNNKKVV